MFSTRSFLQAQREVKVPGIVYNLGEYPPIKINFLSFIFELMGVKYFADVNYTCPVDECKKHVRVELSRDRFLSLNEGAKIVVKLQIYVKYVYGIASPSFSIPVEIE